MYPLVTSVLTCALAARNGETTVAANEAYINSTVQEAIRLARLSGGVAAGVTAPPAGAAASQRPCKLVVPYVWGMYNNYWQVRPLHEPY